MSMQSLKYSIVWLTCESITNKKKYNYNYSTYYILLFTLKNAGNFKHFNHNIGTLQNQHLKIESSCSMTMYCLTLRWPIPD